MRIVGAGEMTDSTEDRDLDERCSSPRARAKLERGKCVLYYCLSRVYERPAAQSAARGPSWNMENASFTLGSTRAYARQRPPDPGFRSPPGPYVSWRSISPIDLARRRHGRACGALQRRARPREGVGGLTTPQLRTKTWAKKAVHLEPRWRHVRVSSRSDAFPWAACSAAMTVRIAD